METGELWKISGKPSLIIIDQGADGLSESYAQNCEGQSFAETDTAGKNGKDICHFCQRHDPSAQKNSGEETVEDQKWRAQRNFPLKKIEEISEYRSEDGDIFIEHDVICSVGDACVTGDDGKPDQQTGKPSGNDHTGAEP